MLVQTVVETPAYLKAAKAAGMTDVEMTAAVDLLSANPEAGDIMQGTGGCRKVRIAGRGHGKSGGYRLITFFASANRPIYLLTVFGKGEKANLTGAEKVALAGMVKRLT
jgi:hypothetical protein